MSANDSLVALAIANAKPGRGGWMRAKCPFCLTRTGKADRRGGLGYQVHTGVWHCFRCSASGKILDQASLPALARAAAGAVPEDIPVVIEFPEGFERLWKDPAKTSDSASDARTYLRKRGVPDSLWREIGVGVTLSGKHYGRIVVPIWAADEETLMGWSARTWDGEDAQAMRELLTDMGAELNQDAPKYLYPFGMDRYHVMFNPAAFFRETDDPVLVVEGVFDALPYWPDASAVLGKPSEGQVETMLLAERPIAVVLDGDAWEQGMMLAMRLQLEGKRAGFVKLPPCTDPNEGVDRAWVREEARRCIA